MLRLRNWFMRCVIRGREAVAMAKQLVSGVGDLTPDEFRPGPPTMIAKLRVSPKVRKVWTHFLNKRTPAGVKRREK